MKKRSYRQISFKTVTAGEVVGRLNGRRTLVLAVDVGKHDMVAAIVDPAAELQERVLFTVGFKFPAEHAQLSEWIRSMLWVAIFAPGWRGSSWPTSFQNRSFPMPRVRPKPGKRRSVTTIGGT